MKIEVECTHCELGFEINVHGKNALEFIKKYGTIQNGKIFLHTCACGHDLKLKEDHKVAEL